MRKKIIWSLFDSETAITQQLNSDIYKVFSIGLPSSSAIADNFIKIDLSKKSCIKKLKQLPPPDIIFASPPCETWVLVSIGITRFYTRNYNEYNLYWQKNFKPNNYDEKHRQYRLLGQKTAYWTFKIIETFKPDMWVIENGASSLIFKYLHRFHGLNGLKNITYYNSYNDVFPEKPTIFFSNKRLYLKKKRKKNKNNIFTTTNKSMINKVRKTNEWAEAGFSSPTAYLKSIYTIKETYCERSAVPIEIYQHILRIYESEGQMDLFNF